MDAVPRISRGPLDDMAEGEAYVLSIARDGDAWAVTEGSAFEASVYRFTLGKDSSMRLGAKGSGVSA